MSLWTPTGFSATALLGRAESSGTSVRSLQMGYLQARRFLLGWFARIGPQPVFVDTPEANSAWTSWLQAIGLQPQRRLMRVAFGPNPSPARPEMVFGLSSFETG